MKQLPKGPLHTDMADRCAVQYTRERTPRAFGPDNRIEGVGGAVTAQVPGAITRFQSHRPAQAYQCLCWHYSKRALASTLLGGAV